MLSPSSHCRTQDLQLFAQLAGAGAGWGQCRGHPRGVDAAHPRSSVCKLWLLSGVCWPLYLVGSSGLGAGWIQTLLPGGGA